MRIAAVISGNRDSVCHGKRAVRQKIIFFHKILKNLFPFYPAERNRKRRMIDDNTAR